MDLFHRETIRNILPYDGIATYHGVVLKQADANHYFNILLDNVEWKNDEAVIFGKHIITKRKVAWYGDDQFSYTYSGTTKQSLAWTKELLELKEITERLTGETYNSCLLNLYHNGDEGMAWHSDDEKSLGRNSAIASLTLGAERKFLFKHKTTKQNVEIFLQNGSLLVMKGTTQQHWLHRLPKTVKVTRPRINLTFRNMVA